MPLSGSPLSSRLTAESMAVRVDSSAWKESTLPSADSSAILAVLLVEHEEVECRETDRDQQQDNECGISAFPADAPCSTHVHLIGLTDMCRPYAPAPAALPRSGCRPSGLPAPTARHPLPASPGRQAAA